MVDVMTITSQLSKGDMQNRLISDETKETIQLIVTVPLHVSAWDEPRRDRAAHTNTDLVTHDNKNHKDDASDGDAAGDKELLIHEHYYLTCHKTGVLWRALVPIFWPRGSTHTGDYLEDASSKTSMLPINILRYMWARRQDTGYSSNPQIPENDSASVEHNGQISTAEDESPPLFLRRTFNFASGKKRKSKHIDATSSTMQKSTVRLVHVIMFPSLIPTLDATFISALIRMEHALLRLQSLSAWTATLGGGYFFCRRLTVSLQLARYQRTLAQILGKTDMVLACTINEAHNLIFLGRFRAARRVLKKLYLGDARGDELVQNQCRAAWLLSKQLQSVSHQLEEYQQYHPNHPLHHQRRATGGTSSSAATIASSFEQGEKINHSTFSDTVDDFQRIRIVRG